MMEFAAFFKVIHGYPPFPWQSMLAEQVEGAGDWPEVIDLPTASGKTAVIDIAVWHLAMQAGLAPEKRTAPRRIWFVVDRRIVVDEAYRRAEKIANALRTDDSLADMADALYTISGFKNAIGTDKQSHNAPPLAFGRLRGGAVQDNGWACFPSQPAVLTSTVDQFGSRLLFRGYGMGPGMWPIHAALAGNDSLLVLDEAHLAEPLVQTLDAFKRYRGEAWAEQPISLPWQVTRMSATPPPGDAGRFPRDADERAAALNHPLLRQRIEAGKVAELKLVEKPKSKKRPPDACAEDAAEAADRFVMEGCRRVAVMMNRVDAAVAVYDALANRDDIGLVLLTGRMRPYDRDRIVERWEPLLASDSNAQPDKPIVLVTTQCLEVGADFSFDALVTECAGLDALRQRFGRLDRLGTLGSTRAVILAWHGDIAPDARDPIYGEALGQTWAWLRSQSTGGCIDFGIASLDAMTAGLNLSPLLPPRPDAPVLLPAYLDAWCQTGPRPHAEAEPALFLHGNQAEQADVQVAFREDFTDDLADADAEGLARLMPPASGELLTVRLHRLRQWLAHEPVETESDIEGVAADAEAKPTDDPPRRWVRYRGRGGQTKAVENTAAHRNAVRPGDTILLPAGESIPRALGHGEVPGLVDIHEQAVAESGRPQTFRLTRSRIAHWASQQPAVDASAILAWLDTEDGALPAIEDWPDIRQSLRSLVPSHYRQAVKNLEPKPRTAYHPSGVLLVGPRRKSVETDPYADADDSYSLIGKAVPLAAHSDQVRSLVEVSAQRCAPQFAQVLGEAAQWHDAGKADPRFQAMLRGHAMPYQTDEPLAKSARGASPHDQELRAELGIAGFRHEMLSLQSAQAEHPDDDLLLHLIASHHGHARPFAPAYEDDIWTGPTPPHHFGSGVAERFWTLNRRYGWWGLAYLEALLRLADHHASRFPRDTPSEGDDHA